MQTFECTCMHAKILCLRTVHVHISMCTRPPHYIFIDSDAMWEWQDETNKWIPYTDTDTQTIEDAHAAGNTTVTMTIMGRSYKIDLSKMEQVNVSTGVSRNIRRNVPPGTSSSVLGTVSSSSTGSTAASNGKKREREEEKDDDVTSKKTKKMKG